MFYPSSGKDKLASFAGVLLEIPNHWMDITESLPQGAPPTLATKEGVGVLQFSVSYYQGGDIPSFNDIKLKRLLYFLEESQGFERQIKVQDWRSEFIFGIKSSYSLDDAFVRVWYCSDGINVALMTFYTDPISTSALNTELSEAEEIALSLRFENKPDLSNGENSRACYEL